MILIDNVADVVNGSISVDIYHRGHLSLRTGTEVTVCLLPPAALGSGLLGMQEMVISPIEFDSWAYLVRVTALFRDRPGVVRKLANAVQDMQLNVVYEESATVDNSRFHRVELLAHTHDLLRQKNAEALEGSPMTTDLPLLPGIERRLKAICLNELVTQGGHPRLKVRPMEGLRSAHSLATQRRRISIVPPDRATVQEEGRIPIPRDILASLNARRPRVILISDTRDRLLRALVPDDNMGLTFVRIRHRDYIGSLYRIANAVSGGFTAVASLTRLKKQGEKNDIELLLHSKAYPGRHQEMERQDAVGELLSGPELADLDIEVAYPKKPGSRIPDSEWRRPVRKGIEVINLEPPVDGEDLLMSLSTPAILQRRIQSYDDMPLNEQILNRERRQAAIGLATEEGVLPVKPQVFISYRFGKEVQAKKAQSMLRSDSSVSFVDGRNPSGRDPFRDVIRDRIRTSQGFIGIWPADGPLDWLLWELGVAHAFGLPTLIVPHERLDLEPHKRLMPEYFFTPFNDRTLADRLKEDWAWFRSEVFIHHQRQLRDRLRRHD